jgi:hypothetical protein
MWWDSTPANADRRANDLCKDLDTSACAKKGRDGGRHIHVDCRLEEHDEDGEGGGDGRELVEVEQEYDALRQHAQAQHE